VKLPKFLSNIFALVFGVFLLAGAAHAQTGYGVTVFNYDEAAGKVYGTSQTYLDYTLGYYYNAGVDGYLIKYTDSTLQSYTVLAQGSVDDDYNAVVFTEANVQRGEIYAVFSDHWIQMTFISGGYYYDPYGLSYNFTGGGDPYYGFQIYQPAYIYQEWVYMGQTGVIVALPNIVQISPTGGIPGTNVLVQIEGKYIGEHTGQFPTVGVSGNGVTATVQNTYPTGVEVIFQIAENADIGDHDVSLTSDGVPSNTVVFRVGDHSPAITSITPPEGNTGESVSVTISGSNFGINPQVQIDGTGVQPTTVTATASEINAVFSIADLTYIGNRNVTIKSNGYAGNGFVLAPGNSDTSNAVQFAVFTPVVQIADVQIVEKNGERTINVSVSGLVQPTDKVKFTLKHLSGTGEAQFDNGSNVIEVSNGENQPLKIKGITESSQANNMTVEATPSNASNVLAHKEFTVATISSITYEKFASDYLDLDNNPGNGIAGSNVGLRIFPDKKDVVDVTTGTADRSLVKIKANVSPNMPGVLVYFSSYDLDDPSAGTTPIDTTGLDGNDNNGAVNGSNSGDFIASSGVSCDGSASSSGVSPDYISKTECSTASDGIAVAAFKTTMQPGDNFAIAANLTDANNYGIKVNAANGSDLIDTSNRIVPKSGEANANNVPAIRTDMLTIWRKLHIEVDSMGPAHENYARGNVSGSYTVNRSLRGSNQVTINLTVNPLEVNRFENGRLEIAAITSVLPVVSNTANTVTVQNTTQSDIVIPNDEDFQLADLNGARSALGNIPTGQTIPPNQTATLTFTGTPLEVNTFSGGAMYLTPVQRSLKVLTNTASSVKVINTGTFPVIIADGTNFRLYDDDDMDDEDTISLNGDENDDVQEANIDLIQSNEAVCLVGTDGKVSNKCNALLKAYVIPEYDLTGSHTEIPFSSNVTATKIALINSNADYFNNIALEARTDFWTIYMVGGYQFTDESDNDPAGSITWGRADALTGGIGLFTFNELNRPTENNVLDQRVLPPGIDVWRNRPVDPKYNTIHELGHLFNGEHDDCQNFGGNAGVMRQFGNITIGVYCDETIFEIRGGTGVVNP
jgi:hypothetical protein